eukprot:m.6494 g.6494  ORF g.6494 m.6494 type:complete len:271 (+) comp16029_c0_seq1:146-958(+)
MQREFCCGAGAAMMNVAVTYPINKVMFRQQLDGVSVSEAVKQLQNDGLRHLFRGLAPPLLQKTASISLMFGLYHEYRLLLADRAPRFPFVIRDSLAAAGAGATEALLAPLERVQTLLQIRKYHDKFSNMYDVFVHLRKYGFREYYRGFGIILLRNGTSNVLFFGLRKPIRDSLPEAQSQLGNLLNDFISGSFLGAFLSTLFYPLNVIKSAKQKSVGGPFYGITKTFWYVFKERGSSWGNMYKGVHVNYTRSFLAWGIINCSYELFMKMSS